MILFPPRTRLTHPTRHLHFLHSLHPMKSISRVALASLALTLFLASSVAQDAKPDKDGFIRNWLVLAPIPLPSDNSGAEGIDKAQLPDEGNLKPKEGDKVKVGLKELTWKKVQTKDYFLDFNEIVGQPTENSVAYAVCYLVVDADVRGLKLKMGSNDQGKLYVNGKELLKYTDPRALEKDTEVAPIAALLKGTKTIVFKVINENNNWQGCIRFTDQEDKPFQNLKVTLNPPAAR